ncbi:NifB/NifX family molybdenum-iron cluster-binding protein [Candidatus Bathyarchaeota archaeon]|nr:NifB/NifX family molybdenum-iron cluster-binding protein [Candidatus Bathyarchaeota archaeon]
MEKIRIAIPTEEMEGLESKISEVLGKAKAFVVVEVEDGEIKNVKALNNPASSYEYGSGPVTAKMLRDLNVTHVFAAEFGPGVSTILEDHDIRMVQVKSNIKVSEAIKEGLAKLNLKLKV